MQCCTGGEERRKIKLGLGSSQGSRPASHFSVLPESAKTSSLPSLPSSLPASQSLQLLAPFRAVPRVREAVFHIQAQLRATATLPFSCECSPFLLPGVALGASWQQPQAELQSGSPSAWREAPVRLERVPWAVPLQQAHLRVG